MKSSIRLALAALALLSALAWSPKPAAAADGTCEIHANFYCSTDGSTISCNWADGSPGTCICDGGIHRWDCF